jgi:hypothetical protein
MARRKIKTVVTSERNRSQPKNEIHIDAAKVTSADSPVANGARDGQMTASRTDIEKLAHELYVRGGYRQGRDVEDWLEAERQALAQKEIISSHGSP